jgi:hypothetical protein
MRCDLAVTSGDHGSGGTDHPGGRLHGGARKTRAARCESDPSERANKNGDEVDAAENAMELKVALADAGREVDGTDQKSEGSSKCMWDEEMAVGNHLQTIRVIHRVIGDEKDLGRDEYEERRDTKKDPETHFESGTAGSGGKQNGRCHYAALLGFREAMCATKQMGRQASYFIV